MENKQKFNKIFSCKFCVNKYSCKASLCNHTRIKHKQLKDIVCNTNDILINKNDILINKNDILINKNDILIRYVYKKLINISNI